MRPHRSTCAASAWRCEEVGINSFAYDLAQSTTEAELLALIDDLNHDERVDGILVQLPLPERIGKTAIIERIDPAKDVDGFHPYNIGRLAQRIPLMRPCTPYGVIRLLEKIGAPFKGQSAVVVGASQHRRPADGSGAAAGRGDRHRRATASPPTSRSMSPRRHPHGRCGQARPRCPATGYAPARSSSTSA